MSNILGTGIINAGPWVGLGGGVFGTSPTSDLWMLPAANFIPAKLTGRVISPRPDVETDTNNKLAYYRYNHSEMDYKVRINVEGLAYPLKFELITSPAGATIGSELVRSIDPATGKTLHSRFQQYGIVKWLNPTAGTETFTARITDQDGTTLDISWTTTQDDTKFAFVGSVGGNTPNDANDGTFENPLETFVAGLWKSSDSDNTFVGKQAVFAEGTYPIHSGTAPSSPILNSVFKPIVYRAFNDEAVTFGTDTGHWRTGGGSSEDLAVIDIECDGSRTDLANNRIFNMQNTFGRNVFWGVSFKNITIGTSGTDNPCCIGYFSNVTKRNDLVCVDCSIDSTVKVQLFLTFASNGVLVENNSGENLNIPASNGAHVIQIKDDTDNVTVRANNFSGFVADGVIEMSNQNTGGQPIIENQEVCWNIVSSTSNNPPIQWNTEIGSPDAVNTHDYKNSVIGDDPFAYRFLGNVSPTPVKISANGYVGTYDGTNFTDVSPVPVSLSASDFDAGDLLTGSARSTHLGLIGGEVAA